MIFPLFCFFSVSVSVSVLTGAVPPTGRKMKRAGGAW